MKWRVIDLERRSAAENMAIDEMLVRTGSEPTIRFYQFKQPSVTIGRKQDASIFTKGHVLERDAVRRITGGNAVYHGLNDLTYSVCAPLSLLGGDIRSAYSTVRGWIVDALNSLEGLTVAAFGENDIVVDGKKICGNAIYVNRENDYVLVHGAVFVRSIPEQWWVSFDVQPNVIQSKLARVANYVKNPDVLDDVHNAFRKTFLCNDLVSETYSRDHVAPELAIIDDLLTRKYLTDGWHSDGTLAGTICATDIIDD